MKEEDMISDEGENISRIVAAKKAIFDIACESDKKYLNNTYSMIAFNKEAQVLLDGGDIYDLAKKKEDIKWVKVPQFTMVCSKLKNLTFHKMV